MKFRRSERCDSTFNPPLFPKNNTVTDEEVTPVLMTTGSRVTPEYQERKRHADVRHELKLYVARLLSHPGGFRAHPEPFLRFTGHVLHTGVKARDKEQRVQVAAPPGQRLPLGEHPRGLLLVETQPPAEVQDLNAGHQREAPF